MLYVTSFNLESVAQVQNWDGRCGLPVEHLGRHDLLGRDAVDPHPGVLEQICGRHALLDVPREHALDAVLGRVADLVPGVRMEVKRLGCNALEDFICVFSMERWVPETARYIISWTAQIMTVIQMGCFRTRSKGCIE